LAILQASWESQEEMGSCLLYWDNAGTLSFETLNKGGCDSTDNYYKSGKASSVKQKGWQDSGGFSQQYYLFGNLEWDGPIETKVRKIGGWTFAYSNGKGKTKFNLLLIRHSLPK